MKSTSISLALLALLCIHVSRLSAEQVTLKNGDRITGQILKVDDKKLVIKTDYAGEISIAWDQVDNFSTTEPMVITRTDQKVVSGPVATKGPDLEVTTSQGVQEVPRTDVAILRSPADQAAYEKSLHPGPFEGWAGGGNFGFAMARGNSETTNLALAFDAVRTGVNDKWIVDAASIYSTDNSTGGATTANNLHGSIRYERNITKKLFGYGAFGGEYDELQDLDSRYTIGAGLGYHAIASAATTLDLLGGFGYSRENYGAEPNADPPLAAVHRNIATASVGDEFAHKFGKNTTAYQRFYFFPYLNQNGNYRFAFDMGTASKISRIFTWNFNFSDRYNSDPVNGNKKNDVVFTTGLGVTFGTKPQ